MVPSMLCRTFLTFLLHPSQWIETFKTQTCKGKKGMRWGMPEEKKMKKKVQNLVKKRTHFHLCSKWLWGCCFRTYHSHWRGSPSLERDEKWPKIFWFRKRYWKWNYRVEKPLFHDFANIHNIEEESSKRALVYQENDKRVAAFLAFSP